MRRRRQSTRVGAQSTGSATSLTGRLESFIVDVDVDVDVNVDVDVDANVVVSVDAEIDLRQGAQNI